MILDLLTRPLAPVERSVIDQSLTCLPETVALLTAAYEGARGGVLVKWMMRCGMEPPLIGVAVAKGAPIAPLIRDSRAFAVCLLDPRKRLVLRTFECPDDAEDTDLFDAFEVFAGETGSPILGQSVSAFDCAMVGHFDAASDHEIYIGQVVFARLPSNTST